MFRHPGVTSAGRFLLATTILAVLAGCGFQLRGASPVPVTLQPLAVECDNQVSDTLCRAVRSQLELSGLTLAAAEDADYRLSLKDFRQDRRATAISADASAAQYTLRHTVHLELVTSDNVPLIASTPISTSESYSYDDTRVLAKEKEEDSLENQMAERLAQQIIFRLSPMTEARIRAIREAYESSGAGENRETP